MADKTVPNLPTSLTSPAVGDLVHVVDISDPNDSAAGTSKKSTLQVLSDFFETLILTGAKIRTALGISTLSGSNTGDMTEATGAEVNTGTNQTKYVSPKAIEDSDYLKGSSLPVKATATENVAGTDDAKFLTALSNVPAFNSFIYRQAVINGNFDIWQRGTSFAAAASTSQYAADRWQIFSANTNTTFSQQANPFDTAPFSMRVQRNNANASTNGLYVAYSLETKDATKFRGQKVTLSFWAKAGANYSPASGYLVPAIRSGTGTDEDIISGFTGTQTDATSNVVLTTSWQKFTLTTSSALRSTVTGLGFQFEMTPVGTAGAADYYEIAQVQLCAGSVVLPFMPKSFATELADSLRYYQKSFIYATTPAQNTGLATGESFGIAVLAGVATVRIVHPLGTKLRGIPVMTTYNPSAANAQLRSTTDNADATGTATTLCTDSIIIVNASGSAGFTANAAIRIHWTADAEL